MNNKNKKHQAVKAGSLHLLGWGGGKSCDLTWFSFYFNLSLYISALFVQSLSGFLYMYIISVIFFFFVKNKINKLRVYYIKREIIIEIAINRLRALKYIKTNLQLYYLFSRDLHKRSRCDI